MNLTACTKCDLTKHWNGADIKCPFHDGDVFSIDNWNCGLIGQIRDICERPLAMAHNDNRIHFQFCNDQKYATIRVEEVEITGTCLWVTWYKSRGKTEAMWLLDEDCPPRPPTFDELKKIVEFYKK